MSLFTVYWRNIFRNECTLEIFTDCFTLIDSINHKSSVGWYDSALVVSDVGLEVRVNEHGNNTNIDIYAPLMYTTHHTSGKCHSVCH